MSKWFILTPVLIVSLLTVTVSSTNSIKVNTTVVKTGDFVRVSWDHQFTTQQLSNIRPHGTRWLTETQPDHPLLHAETKCHVFGDGSGSYWVGQFSPAVTSLEAVKMTGDPAHGHGAGVTEGTPPFTTPAPVKFISGTQLEKGYFDFKVTNMRETINWVLFEGSLDNASNFKVVALSPPLTFTDRDAPSHGRLARTSSVDEMRVSWTSTTGTCKECLVQWGLSAEQLDRTSEKPTLTSYTHNDLCGVPGNSSGFHSPGDLFSIVLDLSAESSSSRLAGLSYFYRYGSNNQGWSAIRSFLAPKPTNANAPMNILVTADMGETYEDGSQVRFFFFLRGKYSCFIVKMSLQ